MVLLLAHEFIRASSSSSSSSSQCMLFVHGMLARRQNLRSFAKMFVNSMKQDALLVDLRGHGESASGEGPHTVQACADDLHVLTKRLNVSTVFGHSFGGKVGLVYCAQAKSSTCVVLDSPPGPWVDTWADRDSVGRLLGILPTLEFHSKVELADKLQNEHHFSAMVALWMTTNFKAPGQFVFDVETCKALFQDYADLDLFPQLRNWVDSNVCFVRAERNPVWTSDLQARMASLPGNVQMR
jgi:pimeloyl-ACP methyl ester carboxylesterase